MASNSTIEWCDHTFNPWWGCTKLETRDPAGSACANCYAAGLARRYGHHVWGHDAARRFFGATHWDQPLRWDRAAARDGARQRVFCASMADVFEDRRDLDSARAQLWRVIERTPNLIWLLLTKRPQHARAYAPWRDTWPTNVWLGTTVEAQRAAEARLHHLSRVPAQKRFVSCEPLLGPLDLRRRLADGTLDWVIAGGESGAAARQSNPDWFRDLRDQTKAAKRSFFFKQWGVWAPSGDGRLVRGSKSSNGRVLDGRTWDEVPE